MYSFSFAEMISHASAQFHQHSFYFWFSESSCLMNFHCQPLRSDVLKINHSWVVTWFFLFFFRLGILVKLELYCHFCFDLMVIYMSGYLCCWHILPLFSDNLPALQPFHSSEWFCALLWTVLFTRVDGSDHWSGTVAMLHQRYDIWSWKTRD